MNIGENLKQLRKTQNFTQKEVAEKLLIARPTYNGYEQNISEPSVETLSKFADFYNTTIDFIVGRETQLINLNGVKPIKKKLIQYILRMNELEEIKTEAYLDGLMGE